MKDSELLRIVHRAMQRNEGSRYICNAIKDIAGRTQQTWELRAWIRHMLNGFNTYDTWLAIEQPEAYRRMMNARGDAFQKGRLAWLDWMIDYCEKEEANAL